MLAAVPDRLLPHPFVRTACHPCRAACAPSTSSSQGFLRTKDVCLHRRLVLPVLSTSNSSHTSTSQQSAPQPDSAKSAVETGLQRFQAGKVDEALALFLSAMKLSPTADEARAALYNSACCYTKQKRWQQATDAVAEAVNKYDLKLSVATKDPDLAPLRDRREWLDSLDGMVGGLSEQSLVQLRSEAKAPFRLTRIIIVGGLLVGASVGLLIITSRLLAALKGGEGSPDLVETLQNLGINGAAVAALGFLLQRDVAASERDKRIVEREEALARLQVAVTTERIIPLAAFRGTTRPLLVAGSRSHVQKVLRAAQDHRPDLAARGLSLVPLDLNVDDPADRFKALKKEFSVGKADKTPKGFGDKALTSNSSSSSSSSSSSVQTVAKASSKDRASQLTPYNPAEWLEWVEKQKSAAGVKGDNVYVQIQLDGTVRASGLGMPPWEKFISDIPPLDDVRSRLMQ